MGKRLCRNILYCSCVCGKDMPEEMGSNTNGFTCSCCENEAMEEETQKIANIPWAKMTEPPVLGCAPLKEIRFWKQIGCFTASRFRLDYRNSPAMGCLKQLCNFLEMAHCHVADEKKLALTFVCVPFGQKLLHAKANFATSRLLILEFIYDDCLETRGTDLEEFAQTTPVGERECCQGCSKQYSPNIFSQV